MSAPNRFNRLVRDFSLVIYGFGSGVGVTSSFLPISASARWLGLIGGILLVAALFGHLLTKEDSSAKNTTAEKDRRDA